jgi:four helix bundle protein
MNASRPIIRHTELRVYRLAFKCAMEIFELSKAWPAEERYSLTSQIRKASRSVCANIAEAWRKRRYPAHFVSKLSDADAESAETQTWLVFARDCGYLDADACQRLHGDYDHICGSLVKMMNRPEPWCGPSVVREGVAEYITDAPE